MMAKSIKQFVPKSDAVNKIHSKVFLKSHGHVPIMSILQREYGVNFGHFNSCMVGEAHCMSSNYVFKTRCETCIKFAHGRAMRAVFGTRKEFLAFKKVLYKHMKRVHWKKE